jgi:hypothetical protein
MGLGFAGGKTSKAIIGAELNDHEVRVMFGEERLKSLEPPSGRIPRDTRIDDRDAMWREIFCEEMHPSK